MSHLTHPPLSWRRWVAGCSDRARIAAAVLVYPIAWLPQLLLFHVMAVSVQIRGHSWTQIWHDMGENTSVWAHSKAPFVVAAAALVVVWLMWARRADVQRRKVVRLPD